jgi:hypothetical protein
MRLLSKLVYAEEFEEDLRNTESERTFVYVRMKGTEPSYKSPAEVEFRKKSII